MRKVIVNEFLSLDGVAQAPGGADEDTSGGFRHGGWQMGHDDERVGAWAAKYISEAGAFLLGRRTYEIFAGYWPNAPGGNAGDRGAAEQEAEARGLDHTHRTRSNGRTRRCSRVTSPTPSRR